MVKKWTIEEWTYMLALADQQLLIKPTRVNKGRVKLEILSIRLQQKWPDGNFGIVRVKGKIYRTWYQKGLNDSDEDDFYIKGSDCLHPNSLKDQEYEGFQNARVELGLPKSDRFIPPQRPDHLEDIVLNTEDSNSQSQGDREVVIPEFEDTRPESVENEDLIIPDSEDSKPQSFQSTDLIIPNSENGVFHSSQQSVSIQTEPHNHSSTLADFVALQDINRKLDTHSQYIARRLDEQSKELKNLTKHYYGATQLQDFDQRLEIKKRDEQITSLMEQRNKFRRLIGELGPLAKDRGGISQAMWQIMDHTGRICENYQRFLSSQCNIPPDDRRLLAPMQAILKSINGRHVANDMASQMGHGGLLHLWIASIICNIFDSSFPDFHDDQSTILNLYRQILLSQKVDGIALLKNLDFLVYETWKKESYFQDVTVETTAEQICSKFYNELHAIVVSHTPMVEAQISKEQDSAFAQVKEECLSLFRACLHLKADMVLTGETYQFRWVQPGNKFDRTCMQIHDQFGHGGTQVVDICLFPMLLVNQPSNLTSEMEVDQDMSRNLVNCDNFLPTEDSSQINLGVVISSALVI